MDNNKNIDYQGVYASMALSFRCISDDMVRKLKNAREDGRIIPFYYIESVLSILQSQINNTLGQVSDKKIKIDCLGSNNI